MAGLTPLSIGFSSSRRHFKAGQVQSSPKGNTTKPRNSTPSWAHFVNKNRDKIAMMMGQESRGSTGLSQNIPQQNISQGDGEVLADLDVGSLTEAEFLGRKSKTLRNSGFPSGRETQNSEIPAPAPITRVEIPTPVPAPVPIPRVEIPIPVPVPTPVSRVEIPVPVPTPTPVPIPTPVARVEIPIPIPAPDPTPTPTSTPQIEILILPQESGNIAVSEPPLFFEDSPAKSEIFAGESRSSSEIKNTTQSNTNIPNRNNQDYLELRKIFDAEIMESSRKTSNLIEFSNQSSEILRPQKVTTLQNRVKNTLNLNLVHQHVNDTIVEIEEEYEIPQTELQIPVEKKNINDTIEIADPDNLLTGDHYQEELREISLTDDLKYNTVFPFIRDKNDIIEILSESDISESDYSPVDIESDDNIRYRGIRKDTTSEKKLDNHKILEKNPINYEKQETLNCLDIVNYFDDIIFVYNDKIIIEKVNDDGEIIKRTVRNQYPAKNYYVWDGTLYFLYQGLMYIISNNVYKTEIWNGQIWSKSPENIIYASTSLDESVFWIQTKSGQSYLFRKESKNPNIIDYPTDTRRIYGYDINHYCELNIKTNILSYQGDKYIKIKAALLNHENELFYLGTKEKRYTNLKIKNWEIVMIKES